VSYVKGAHNFKAGVTYEHTFLTENDSIGIVDPGVVPGIAPSCLSANGSPIPGTPCATLAPYDLTTGGTPFHFHGHTDIKELALYVQDSITKRNWTFNLGIRGDLYNGIVTARQAEPRLGIACNIKPTNTMLQVSYARTLETPFNENLITASTGCSIPFLATLVPPPGVTCHLGPIHPGWRNEFHVGLQQAFGRFLVIMRNTFGSTRITHSTLALLGPRQFTFQSSGRVPRSLVTPFGPAFPIPRAYSLCEHVRRRRPFLPAASCGAAHHPGGQRGLPN
jgi:hypothetical protein